MTRLRGRAPVGRRLVEKVPHGHWKTTTLIAALGITGIRCSTVVDGAVNAATCSKHSSSRCWCHSFGPATLW